MTGRLSKAVSAVAIIVFCWYMLGLIRVALQLFYPATHIPLIKPLAELPAGTPVHRLAWREPFEYEASMYVSEMESFINMTKFFNSSTCVWQLGPQNLSQKRPRFASHIEIDIPSTLRETNSTSLYMFLFVRKAGQSSPHPNIGDPLMAYARAQLISIRPRKINRKHLLIDGKSTDDHGQDKETDVEEYSTGPWVPHGKSKLDWEIVLEDNQFSEWNMPLDIAPYLRTEKNNRLRNRLYIPLLWENPLAVRSKHWVPLTNRSSVSAEVPLEALTIEIDTTLKGIGLGWFRLSNYVYQGLLELRSPRALIQYTESDVDSLKEMVYEVNPTMLGITIIAMAFHMLFEFLAYKEDVSFWSKKDAANLQGISRSSILMSLASAWISLLYMWDRRSETNIVVLLGSAVGAIVEGWKATKVLHIGSIWSRFRSGYRNLGSQKKDKKKSTETHAGHSEPPAKPKATAESKLRERVQREVDRQTAWYMIRVCVPLMVAYATFSLVYQQYESYLSWVLHISLVTVYSLEFIQMWPQLLINHKLKTVDMLPLTAFLYRFLLTFIDDLYALVVPMPLIERIGTLRDDVVFIVLCYQWFKFPRRKPADSSEKDEEAKKND
ncbi:Cleft lip and palate associated transmembrane protein 1 [Coemansia sp. RSA 1365]|nr:Cleft lip and palate associated transmembrane protein 1 [Coemansia sp. RSA 1365]